MQPSHTLGQTHTAVLFLHLGTGDLGGVNSSKCRKLGTDRWRWPKGWAGHGTVLVEGGGRQVRVWAECVRKGGKQSVRWVIMLHGECHMIC